MAASDTGLGLWGVPLAILAGAIRNSTPFVFVSLGETLTEKSGRINLGQEGTLVMGAMAGFAVSYLASTHGFGTGLSPWIGGALRRAGRFIAWCAACVSLRPAARE